MRISCVFFITACTFILTGSVFAQNDIRQYSLEKINREIKLTESEITIQEEEIQSLETEVKESKAYHEYITRKLIEATSGVKDALWRAMWYDAAIDAASMAVDIALSAKEVGLPAAIIRKATEELAGVVLVELGVFKPRPTSGPDIGSILVDDPKPAVSAWTAVGQTATGLGESQVKSIMVDFFEMVKKHIMANRTGKLTLEQMKQAIKKGAQSQKGWKGEGKEILISLVKSVGFTLLKDVDRFFQDQPEVAIYVARRLDREQGYRDYIGWLKATDKAREWLDGLQAQLVRLKAEKASRSSREETVARTGVSVGVANFSSGEVMVAGSKFNTNRAIGIGATLEMPVSSRITLGLGINTYGLQTSGTLYDYYVDDWGFLWEQYIDKNWELRVRPVIFFGTIRLSPAYVGMGVGIFPTWFKVDWEREVYVDGILVDTASGSGSDRDSPIGLVLLIGYQVGGKRIFFNLEASYIVGAKANLEDFGTEVALGGLQVSLRAGLKLF